MRRCPVCRAPFDDALPVPDPRDDPGGWFAAVDANGDGKLSPGEVLEALKARVPCDWRRLERDVLPRAERSRTKKKTRRALFDAWDPDGDGFIELREMVAPGGLLEYVTREFTKERAVAKALHEREKEPLFATTKARKNENASSASDAEPPALARHPDAWFAHWDEDGSGTLDKEEVTRALVKTLRREREREEVSNQNQNHAQNRASYASLLTSVAAARAARRVVDAIWPVFCADASAGVDRAAFLAPDGLAEAIVANMRPSCGGSPGGTESFSAVSSPARRGARARSFDLAAEKKKNEKEKKPASRGFVGPSRGGGSSLLLRPALARTRSAPSRGAAYRE